MYESTFSTKKNGAKPAISGRILNFISVRVCRTSFGNVES